MFRTYRSYTKRRRAVHAAGIAALIALLCSAAAQDTDEPPAPQLAPESPSPTTRPAGAAPDVAVYERADASDYLSGLIGSPHDFSQQEKHPRDMCLPCHAPHLPVPGQPLLEAEPPAPEQFRTYQGYDVELNSSSLLCLSCHDGVVATEVYTSSHATRLAQQLGASQLGYGGLQGHPVGVAYPIADPYYNPAASLTASGVKVPGGRIQCTSCHDPHNTGRHKGLLVTSNERSRLCLACHRL